MTMSVTGMKNEGIGKYNREKRREWEGWKGGKSYKGGKQKKKQRQKRDGMMLMSVIGLRDRGRGRGKTKKE